MKSRSSRKLTAALLTGLVLAMVAGLQSSSAPQVPEPPKAESPKSEWPMFGINSSRNLFARQARNLPTEWDVEKGVNIKWKAQLGSTTYGSPVVADGRIFVGTNNQMPRDPKDRDERGVPIDKGVLMCFRASDGEFLWQATHHKLATSRINDWPRAGLCSSPCVEGDRLYYVSNRCELICASAATGKAIWTLDMIGELGVFPHNMAACSPLVVGDLVFAVTANGVDEGHVTIPAPQAPSFVAVNKRTGKVVWQENAPTINAVPINQLPVAQQRAAFLNLVNAGELVGHGQWSNPTFSDVAGQPQVIFPGGDGWLRAYDPPTGKLLWKFDGNPKNAVFNLAGTGTRSHFIGTPVVDGSRLYANVGQDPEHYAGEGHLWCIDLVKAVIHGRNDPDCDVSPKQNNFDPSALINQKSALQWHFGGPTPAAVRAKTGRRYEYGRSLSTCAVADGLVYAADFDGSLYCLDAITGEVYWRHDADAMSWSSPVCADGKVFFGNDEDILRVFAHGKKKEILGENDMAQHVRTVPAVVGNVLYVCTRSTLYAVSNEKKVGGK